MKKLAYLGLLCVLPIPSFASIDPFALSLEELMNVPVSVSSRKPLSQRETPGIVTVITSEEIRNSGARNLVDVLRQVPGMDFRMMVYNGLGLGMRGLIGSDGRVLMLVDGIEMNERRNGSAVFGQGFPVEQISRIEIIRGSALALYGGAAELGVINIVTHNAEELDGTTVTGSVSHSTAGDMQSGDKLSIMSGKKLDNGLKWSAMLHASHDIRSDRYYYASNGSSFDMQDANHVALSNLNLGVEYKNFNARFIHDEPRMDDRDGVGFGAVAKSNTRNTFASNSLLMQYNQEITPNVSLKPSLTYQEQTPRKRTSVTGVLTTETSLEHWQLKIPASWEVNKELNLSAGIEHTEDSFEAVKRPSPGLPPLPFASTRISSQYTEMLLNKPWGILTTSIRFDEHQQAGTLRAARVGFTKVKGNWHYKLTASHARSAPWMESYAFARALSVKLIPETTRSWEIEGGYRITPDMQLTVNLFNTTVFDLISSVTGPKAQTRGLEANLKTRQHWGYADISYSLYSAIGTEAIDIQPIDYFNGNALADSSTNLAFPKHKLTANLHYQITPNFSVNPSLVYLGKRWAYTNIPKGSQNGVLTQMPEAALVNVSMHWENVLDKKLDVALSLHNILNKDNYYIQPFNAGHPPLPDMGREVTLRAQYKF